MSFTMNPENQEPLWKTKDGRLIKVSAMAGSHISNALAMLRRAGYVSQTDVSHYLGYPPPNGEAAYDCWEREFDAVMDAPTSKFIALFEAELRRRVCTCVDLINCNPDPQFNPDCPVHGSLKPWNPR